MFLYRRLIALIFSPLLFTSYLFAQDDKLTEEDKKSIQFESRDFIKEVEGLMNLIKDPTVPAFKRKEIINNSYNETANQIFLN
ncbi:MAG: hypothetical protein AAGI07_13410, partial [Bacteroidota bacterium]